MHSESVHYVQGNALKGVHCGIYGHLPKTFIKHDPNDIPLDKDLYNYGLCKGHNI